MITLVFNLMEWSFGIITDFGKEEHINTIISSIEEQGTDNYEILIIGKFSGKRKNTKVIDFNENIKPKWITKKKNIITQQAKYKNIVYLHDYIKLQPGWYDNFVKFGEDWDVCMNKILNSDNKRFRDWTLWEPFPLDYNDNSRTKEMYVSGSYFCAKKDFMIKYPLNEKLIWNQCEDLEWSFRVRDFWNYKCNQYSVVKFLKYKEDQVFCNYALAL